MTAIDAPIDDQTTANACANLDVGHLANAAPGPAAALAERPHVRIIIDIQGTGKLSLQPLPEIEIIPARHMGRRAEATQVRRERPRNAQSNAKQRLPANPLLFEK